MVPDDATAHLSEELHNAAISGPVAIFQAVLVSWVRCCTHSRTSKSNRAQVIGWLLNVALGFGVGNVADTLATPMGNPAAQVFLNAGGRSGGLAMWFWPILIQFFTGMRILWYWMNLC